MNSKLVILSLLSCLSYTTILYGGETPETTILNITENTNTEKIKK